MEAPQSNKSKKIIADTAMGLRFTTSSLQQNDYSQNKRQQQKKNRVH